MTIRPIAILLLLTFFISNGQSKTGIGIKEINTQGVHAKLYAEKGQSNLPTLVVVSGSGGGIAYSEKFGMPLAQKGYAVLALPYWKYKNLPEKLSEIPLKYFYTALDILKKEKVVDKRRIGIIGYSRGGELALLLASKTEDIKAIVGLSPGAYVAPNIDFKNWWNLKSAWTENGKALAFSPKKRKVEEGNWNKVFKKIKQNRNRDSLIANFQKIKDSEAFEESAIKVENIKAPILLISGGKDLTWSAETMSDYVIERLHRHQFPYFNAHLNYPLAGHDFVTLGLHDNLNQEELNKKYVDNQYKPGGTVKDNMQAGKQSWKQIMNFLDIHLK